MQALAFETGPIDAYSSIDAWRAEAPQVVARMIERWGLLPGEAFVGGVSASVLRVRTENGAPAVLKVGFPHREGIWEAVGIAALADGVGPALLAQDAWTWSMLLEEVRPGTPLRDAALPVEEALRIAGELHQKLAATPADDIPTIERAWATDLGIVRARLSRLGAELSELGVLDLATRAVDDFARLAAADTARTLLHGDFNPGNMLLSGTGWRIIDPKPLRGDAAYDLWPLISQLGTPFESIDLLRHSVELAAEAARADPSRVAAWSFALAGINLTWNLETEGSVAGEIAQLRAWNELVSP